MKTPMVARNLDKQPPHSPRARFGGFAILGRTVDKCRASIDGTLGDYHYDCPLDNQLFRFKGVTGDQFKTAVAGAKNYEDVATWLESTGTRKSPEEIKKWSDKMEALLVVDMPEMSDAKKHEGFIESCHRLGLAPDSTTLFEWLEADDAASFQPHLQPLGK